MNYEFDSQDQEILNGRMANRDQIEGPRLGDYVLFPSGQLERISNKMDGCLQTSPVKSGSFYLFGCGEAQFGGSLNPSIPTDSLALTEEVRSGTFWFFHHDEVGAHRGVTFEIPCRIYETRASYAGYLS